MVVAHVVPLQRLPADRPWFDYLVPPDLPVKVGHLVEIQFGRRLMPGVIWALSDQSTMAALKPINRIIQPEPVVNPWQHQTITKIADWYFVSLGHLVTSVVPDYPKKLVDQLPPPPPPLRFHQAPNPHERTWWYRDRQQAIKQSIDWLLKDDAPRVICTPTIEDLYDYEAALGDDRVFVGCLESQMGERDYRLLYERIRTGQLKKVIGTGRSLLLPFQRPPGILLDQEEHPAHRQSEQHPRLDNRQTVELIAPQAVLTAPAPSLKTFITRHPHPPSFQGQRQLAALGQPGSRDWLTPDAEQLINETLQRGKCLLAIVPHHGFAQRVACRECGWTVTCTNCGRRIRLLRRNDSQADCQACGAVVEVPTNCPRCHAVSWNLSGLGVEQFLETVRQRWPKVLVQPADQPPTDGPCITVGTYQAYRLRGRQNSDRPVLIVSGDALLSYPDFAVAERAWAYLSRLQAVQPNSLVMVQTYEPDLAFWQRWRHGDDRSWYDDELAQRTSLVLPPAAEHWIARLPNGDKHMVEHKYREVLELVPSGVTVTILNEDSARQRDRTTGRLLFQAPVGTSLRLALDWLKIFPPPWQLDPAIRGWAD